MPSQVLLSIQNGLFGQQQVLRVHMIWQTAFWRRIQAVPQVLFVRRPRLAPKSYIL